MLKNCRHYIAQQDITIHLGDVIFYQYAKLKEMLDSIPGRKFLVMGNHDQKSRNWYMNNGFDGAFDSLQIGNVLLTHKPYKNLPESVDLNIHGHFHNTDHRKYEPEFNEWYDQTRYKLLAIEYTNYCPVQLDKFSRSK